jgi:Domain of unknown function (DUF4129)
VQTSSRQVRGAVAGLGLTGPAAVAAMVARMPLSGSTPIDARSAGAPVTALFMVALGAGIVALTGLVLAVWPGWRRRGEDDPEPVPEDPQIQWFWKLVAILLPLALGVVLLVAAVLGLKAASHLASAGPGPPAAPRPGVSPRPPRLPSPGFGNGFVLPAWLPWTVLAILMLALAAGVWVTLRWWREPRTAPSSEQAATGAAVQAAVAALDTIADPREAVIAAYAAMERALAARGVARRSAEAPREYLQRVLIARRATEQEAMTLTGLFEEARFSTHPMSEPVRGLALSALSSLQARLADAVR